MNRSFWIGFFLGLSLITVCIVALCLSQGALHWALVRTISRSERTFYQNVLEVSYKMLLEYQLAHDELPRVNTDREFEREYFPRISVSGSALSPSESGELLVRYANDPNLRLDTSLPEVVIVALRVTSSDGKSIHLLTSWGHVVQSIDFEERLWDSEVVGHPVPYDLLRRFIWTNLTEAEN